MKVLLITPPMTQINSPYPATGYLLNHLRSRGVEGDQKDLGLDLILKLFSKIGIADLYSSLKKDIKSPSVQFFKEAIDDYQRTIEPVIQFLQGHNPTLSLQIARRSFLPEGPRFVHLNENPEILHVYGSMGTIDKAKYLASLYLDDLSDVIRDGIDSDFGFSRYAEHLASSQNDFTALYTKLNTNSNLISKYIEEIVHSYLSEKEYSLVGLTVPFAGNAYGAFLVGQIVKRKSQKTKVVIGGGFVNTELRELGDIRVFEFVDYIVFDDGELPLERVIELLNFQQQSKDRLIRTLYLENKKIIRSNFESQENTPFKLNKGPSLEGLNLGNYFSMVEMPNPMHRMWSDYRWNKMILAHGCYWKKCSFCDTSLDYIQRFEPAKASDLVDQMTKISLQTQSSGFHFVDEAAPPALLRAVSKEIIQRQLSFSWWGNLRFDPQFNDELTQLMADAGCVAVTGGLEVASDRILGLINKGVSIEQVARVTHSFKKSGIFVHAYLMYGFPTQTVQETVDSLEVVRQLFINNCLDSGYWHRFMVTAHSPVGLNPDQFHVRLLSTPKPQHGMFAKYEVPFVEREPTNLDVLGAGLRKALYNYMHGIGLDEDVRSWFEIKVPKTKIERLKIKKIIDSK